MSNRLYGRRCRIVVGTGGGAGLEVSELRCTFSVEKSMSAKPNSANIKIYNLSDQSRNAILTRGNRVIIEAGYDGPQYGTIYDGDVIQTLRYADDAVSSVTEVVSQDGDVWLNGSFVNRSYAAGETPSSLISSLAGDGGTSVGIISENISETQLPRGKAMFGQPKDYARNIAKGEDALVYVNDRKICLVKPADLPPGEAVNLNPASGLVGIPERTDSGIKAKCLLNPLLNINMLVYIDNSLVKQIVQSSPFAPRRPQGNGVYRILTLTHTGDTRGNDWYTEITGVAQPGMIPETGSSFVK